MQGVELSLVGTWNIDDFESDDIPIGIDDVDGTVVLTCDDKYDIDDDGTTKADWTTHVIQFFTNNDDENYSYTLSNCGKNLVLENSDSKFECTKAN